MPSKPVWVDLRLPRFEGRDDLLADMHKRLTAGDSGLPRNVVLWGQSGVGKTSAAVEYVYRHLDSLGVVWQFSAGNRLMLADGFAELAAELGARELADARNPVRSAHAVLARYPEEWLLLFDNAQDIQSLREFLPRAGNGRVLITSQNSEWPDGWALNIPELGTDSAGYLVKRTSDPDLPSAIELAEEMGGLPLALEQAAANIKATGGSLAGYLGQFRQRRSDLREAHGESADRMGGTVDTTFSLAFARLEVEAPAAASLLRLIAFLADEPVPLSLVLASHDMPDDIDADVADALTPLIGDQFAQDQAVSTMCRYSLMTEARPGMVQVHKLVQAATRDQMPADIADRWRRAASKAIEAAIPQDTKQPATWPTFAALLAHAQATLPESSNGLGRIAEYLLHSGSYVAARDLQRKVVDARRVELGPDHRETLAAEAQLARFIGIGGDVTAARDRLAELLPSMKRVLGPEHPTTLQSRATHAMTIAEAEDAARARDLYSELLPSMKRVLGAEHPETLETRAAHAMTIAEAGNPARARRLFSKLLRSMERVLGAEHPTTLQTRAAYAMMIMTAWPDRARDLLSELLPSMERVLGAEHPATLETRAAHAMTIVVADAADAAMARDLFSELLPSMERVLGAENRWTCLARMGNANAIGLAGDTAMARNLHWALWTDSKRTFGADHSVTREIRLMAIWWTGIAGAQSVSRFFARRRLGSP